MGLKQDLIDAKKEGLKLSGATKEAIQQAENVLDAQAQLEVDAIVNFLTKCQFRITQLQSNVVLENFKKKLGDITSYVFFDYRDLLVNGGEVKLYEIPVEDVRKLWEDGKLGTRTSISVKPRKYSIIEIEFAVL